MPTVSRPVASLIALLLVVGRAAACLAQSPPSTGPAVQIMILGVFHFANPNPDYAQSQGTDVLAPAHQRELEAVVQQLARFQPTRIALERAPSEADSINADYRRYLAGDFTLSRNEIHQLGFRLAAQQHLPQLYPVDLSAGHGH